MQLLFGVLALLGILAAIGALMVLGIALIRRDKDRVRGSGALGNAMQEVEGLFVESKKKAIEAKRRDDADHSQSSDPPVK
jgi:hypothetical protein